MSREETLVHIKIDAYGVTRDDAIKAVRGAFGHLCSGFNGGHGRTSGGVGRYVVQYDEPEHQRSSK